MTTTRIKVAAATNRMEPGALQMPSSGRRKKPASERAQNVTHTLWPHEIEAFEALRAEVNAGLPAAVGRSDMMRVALRLLLMQSATHVTALLVEARDSLFPASS